MASTPKRDDILESRMNAMEAKMDVKFGSLEATMAAILERLNFSDSPNQKLSTPPPQKETVALSDIFTVAKEKVSPEPIKDSDEDSSSEAEL